ncbi:hypothetical protein BC830DRAFT_1211149 [Chytriomyces sp. MP71]|nr:hypothetical protein BC830DRAFT_1211149 [Chytriomyces sp. MP71]
MPLISHNFQSASTAVKIWLESLTKMLNNPEAAKAQYLFVAHQLAVMWKTGGADMDLRAVSVASLESVEGRALAYNESGNYGTSFMNMKVQDELLGTVMKEFGNEQALRPTPIAPGFCGFDRNLDSILSSFRGDSASMSSWTHHCDALNVMADSYVVNRL